MPKLKEYDERLVSAFLTNYKVVDIMKETGLSKKTIYKYKNDPDFQKIIHERKNTIIQFSVNKMQSNLTRNVDTLQAIIDDPDTAAQTKVNAIQIYLNQMRDFMTTAEILKQLADLQDAFRNGSGTF